MRIFNSAILLVCGGLLAAALSASESQAGYAVKYAGGSLPLIDKGLVANADLALFIDSDQVRLQAGRRDVAVIPASSISEISHGEEIHRKFGKKVGLSATKEYIGLTWDKGNVVLDADKDEYRSMLLALEGVTGKKTVEKNPHNPHKK
jgi:hypothetical protein